MFQLFDTIKPTSSNVVLTRRTTFKGRVQDRDINPAMTYRIIVMRVTANEDNEDMPWTTTWCVRPIIKWASESKLTARTYEFTMPHEAKDDWEIVATCASCDERIVGGKSTWSIAPQERFCRDCDGSMLD